MFTSMLEFTRPATLTIDCFESFETIKEDLAYL